MSAYKRQLFNTTEERTNENDVSEQGGEQQQEQLPQSIFHLNFRSPSNWREAIVKLRRIKDSKSPTHMLVQVLATVHSIHTIYYNELKQRMQQQTLEETLESVESMESMESATESNAQQSRSCEPPPLGADDFLPVFVYVTACANLPHPQTTFQMIAHLSNRDRLEGMAKYFLTVFESALWFLASGSEGFVGANDDEEEDPSIGGSDAMDREEKTSSGTVSIVATTAVTHEEHEKNTKEENTNEEPNSNNREEHCATTSLLESQQHRLSLLERQMKELSQRLKSVDRMVQFNAMSLSSSKRRGSALYKTSLTPIKGRQTRTTSEEVVGAL